MNAHDLLHGADAVLSDMDGTLVDSDASVRRAWGAFALRHGLDRDTVYACVQGRPSRETIPLLVPDADHASEIQALDRAELEDSADVIALPGARELLAGHWPLAVVTSAPAPLARARLAAAGLRVPDVLVTVEDVQRGKPDPECFLIGAERLGVDPRRCLVLEDAPAGITAGRRAGATVIAVRSSYGDGELAEADLIIDHLAALFDGSQPG